MKLEERRRLVNYIHRSIDNIVYERERVESERERLNGVLIFSHDFLKIIEWDELNSIKDKFDRIVYTLLYYPDYYPVELDEKIESLSENDRKKVKRLISQIMMYGHGKYKEESENE